MRSSKAEIVRRVHATPQVTFDGDRTLTSFAGLVLFQALFAVVGLRARLRACFEHLDRRRDFGHARVLLQLVVHVLMGFRRLRDRDYYADDPLVCRVLGVSRLPDVATISRTLATADHKAVVRVRRLVGDLALDRAVAEELPRVTLDFDGSVLATRRHAEGTAVGYNPRRKGTRSYYPLFCTLSQLGMFIDMHHRAGNVHDSNGAVDFVPECIERVRRRLPRAVLEARLDSAFFHQDLLATLEEHRVQYAVSLPFANYVGLRHLIDSRERWVRIDETWSYFETPWRPKRWRRKRRVILIRQRRAVQRKGPLQLDLFEVVDHEFEYKAIVTNKRTNAANVLPFLNGRGCQEAILGDGKEHASLDYIPCRRRVANQLYSLAAMLAHKLQLCASPTRRGQAPTRAPQFELMSLGTLRHRLIRRAGRLTRPQGRLQLRVAANGHARRQFRHHLDPLLDAA
ncbi:MAG: IS1380 family transposase [Nannocystaceae bacterium]